MLMNICCGDVLALASLESWSAETTLAVVLTLHTLIGVIGALVAYWKGRSLSLWLLIGVFAGTAAFLTALLMKRHPHVSKNPQNPTAQPSR